MLKKAGKFEYSGSSARREVSELAPQIARRIAQILNASRARMIERVDIDNSYSIPVLALNVMMNMGEEQGPRFLKNLKKRIHYLLNLKKYLPNSDISDEELIEFMLRDYPTELPFCFENLIEHSRALNHLPEFQPMWFFTEDEAMYLVGDSEEGECYRVRNSAEHLASIRFMYLIDRMKFGAKRAAEMFESHLRNALIVDLALRDISLPEFVIGLSPEERAVYEDAQIDMTNFNPDYGVVTDMIELLRDVWQEADQAYVDAHPDMDERFLNRNLELRQEEREQNFMADTYFEDKDRQLVEFLSDPENTTRVVQEFLPNESK